MRNLILLHILLVFFCSCKSEKKNKNRNSSEENKITAITSPVQGNSSLPRLFSTQGLLYMSWVQQVDTVAHLKYAILQEDQWSPSTTIISGTDWFVNWADFPAFAATGGNILTNMLQKSDVGTYTYDVKLNLYANNTWKKNFVLHDDNTKTEHGFVTIKPYVANSFMVTWLDGRNTEPSENHDAHHGKGAMSLRAAIVFEDGTVDYDTLLDNRVCDCCQTTAAIGPNDEIIVAYRDRSDEEVRDISVVRWEMSSGWSQPQTIGNDNWKIEGCPVNGPSMDASNNSLALAWFTAAAGEGVVNLAFSEDVGANFKEPIRIDAGNATGRVDVTMINDAEAAVLWMEPNGEEELIQLVKVSMDGTKGDPLTITKTSPECASGFPQLEKVGSDLYIAWTLVEDDTKTVKVEKVAIEEF